MPKYKVAAAKASSSKDETAYWIRPLGDDGEPVVPEGTENCDHEEARKSWQTKVCKVCGAVRYKRVSTFIKAGEVPADYENLQVREQRYVIAGLLENRKLIEDAEGLDPDGDFRNEILVLNGIVKKAMREAGIWTKAERGTVVHAWTEDVDNGYSSRAPLADKPDPELFGPAIQEICNGEWKNKGTSYLFFNHFKALRKDVQAYMDLSEAHGVTFERAEAMIVIDDYEVAGKLDRLGNVALWSPQYCCSKLHVFDTKTGSVEHGKRTKVMQFGSYALGSLYDDKTFRRTESGACTETAYIMHIPKEQPSEPALVKIPLTRAKIRLDLAHEVWTEHATKNSFKAVGMEPWLLDQVSKINNETDMDAFFARTHQYWTDEVGKAAESRIAACSE